MTFGQLARLQVSTDRYQHKNYQAKMPNGSVPGPGYVNPYALPGMDITGIKHLISKQSQSLKSMSKK